MSDPNLDQIIGSDIGLSPMIPNVNPVKKTLKNPLEKLRPVGIWHYLNLLLLPLETPLLLRHPHRPLSPNPRRDLDLTLASSIVELRDR